MAARAGAAIPIAAIFCLGLILLAIAATIILALIPVYTSQKSVTLGAINSKQKSLSYSIPVSSSTTSGALSSSQTSQLSSSLQSSLTSSESSNGGLTVSSGTVSSSGRRKRQTGKTLFLIILIFARTSGFLNTIQNALNSYITTHQSAIATLVSNLLTTTTTASVVSTAASGRRRRNNILLRRQAQQAALEAAETYKD